MEILHGRYQLIQVLGSGGFGLTYLATDTHHPDNPIHVVKQFKPANQDAAFLDIARRLFLSEVGSLRKLGTHDRIPALIDDFEQDQQFYLVQEYVEGRSLTEELAEVKQLDEPQTIALLRDVLEILEFVHSNQVIHRDIKPSNLIRRNRDGRLALIDFGAVKEIQTQLTAIEPGQTNLTVGIGTQGYVPSEQLMGKPRYSSDIYALGMTAIQALTGTHPCNLPTDPDTAEVVWHDRTQVSPWLAKILDRMTRYHFTQRFQSASDVLQALNQTNELSLTSTPALETMLPQTQGMLYPATELSEAPSTVESFGLKPRQPRPPRWWVAAAGLLATGVMAGIRYLGWMEPLELAVYDRLVQASPGLGEDDRLVVVGINEADIATYRFPLPDRILAQALQKLQTYEPRVIGVDLLRDSPQDEPNGQGRSALLGELKQPNVISITNLGNANSPVVPAPPGVPPQQVGFNDLVLDNDLTVRRNLMFADSQDTTFYSFSLRLALTYLAKDNIKPQPYNTSDVQWKNYANPNEIFLVGKAVFRPLWSDDGGYNTADVRGYQILLHYRGRQVARQLSLTDVLAGKAKPEWLRDKVVLLGTTAPSVKDLFLTPYSTVESESPRMPGVLIHAHATSQLLSAALEGRSLVKFWPNWAEFIWIGAWALAGAGVVYWLQRPVLRLLAQGVGVVTIGAVSVALFSQPVWIPVVAPVAAYLLASGLTLLRQSATPQWPSKIDRPLLGKKSN